MATADDIKQAVGCLTTVFPQFVAKELANLTDQIFASVQGFTDPMAAIADLNLTDLLDDVGTLSSGDVFSDLDAVAGGLLTQYSQRELESAMQSMAEEYPGATKAVHKVRNMSEQIVSNGMLMMSLYKDLPYASAQRIGEMIIRLDDMKIKNLQCLRKHIVQLVNAILVLAKNVETYKDDTFAELKKASEQLVIVKRELLFSHTTAGSTITFDSKAFERARQAMIEVINKLTPDKDGTSILDAATILSFGSVESGQVNVSNRALTTLVIPSLTNLIEAETAAYVSHVSVINYYVKAMGAVVQSFQNAANTSRVAEQRSRAVSDIQVRVDSLSKRIDIARARENLRAASSEMLFWSSRAKAIVALMDRVKQLSFEEGSIEGADKAFAIEEAFQKLLDDLLSIENFDTDIGIEDTTVNQSQLLSLTAGARRIMKDLDEGRATANSMATLHALAIQVATGQVSSLEESITVAQKQKVACETFNEIEIGVTEQLDQLTDSMRQLGMDRGADLLNSGQFTDFLESDLDTLSYLGIAIQCLAHGLNGIEDSKTRQQVSDIRDDLLGQETNLRIAAVDSAVQGRTRFIDRTKEQMANLQKNAKTIESIVEELKSIGVRIGADLSDAAQGIDAFSGNLDQLGVGAGGRLSQGLEEFSDHPNAGVPLCDLT